MNRDQYVVVLEMINLCINFLVNDVDDWFMVDRVRFEFDLLVRQDIGVGWRNFLSTRKLEQLFDYGV